MTMINSSVIQSQNEQLNLSTMKGDMKMTENIKPMSSLLDIQPWILSFKAMCITDQFNASSLNNLMTYFIRNVRTNVNECQTKPLRADKLRGFISETLLFFMYYYKAQKEKYDEATYMNLMSDLLAMYIDTELKASKRSSECHESISGRIASYLYVYLGNSAEYLLDTLFKIRFMSSNYHQILHPVIKKIFNLIPKNPTSSLMYVRYFLIYRIWKRITKDQNAKNEINSIAMASLCSPPTSFPQHIMDYVLPKVPNTQKITSRILLQQPIELEKSCESFVQFCRQSESLRNAVETEQNRCDVTVESFELEDKLSHKSHLSICENSTINNSLSIVDSSKQSNLEVNSEKNINSKSSCKSLTSGNVMLIDLTSDDSPDRVIRQKSNQKRCFSWARSLLKRKLIVSPPSADNTNETYEHITEDSQPIEDTIGIQSLTITTNDNNWMIGLELTSIEMAELNLSFTNESTMKIDELKTSNQLYDELLGDSTTNRQAATCKSSIKQLNNINENNSIIESNDVLLDPIEFKTIVQPKQISIDVIEEAEVEVTTTDLNIINVPSECIDNTNKLNNEYLVEVAPKSVELNIVDEIKINTKLPISNTNSELTGRLRDTVLHLNECLKSTNTKFNEIESSKIQDVEFHENIDGLSLLASVSQRVSHLSTTSETQIKPREIIKVKNYSSLMNVVSKAENEQHNELLCDNELVKIHNNMDVFPDDDINKVAMHVEVTSSEDVLDQSYKTTICKQQSINNYCLSNNEQLNEMPIVSMQQVDNSIQSDKDDTNVILNGETIVLLQKSPNSNLYIINKAAVENKEHINEADEDKNLIEKNQTIDKINNDMYSYEIYDSMYRIGPSASSTTSYEMAQNTNGNVRSQVMDLKKTGKKKGNNSEVISPRRRRVKQEFNGCSNSTCQDLVETHSIHIPPPSSLYHPNYNPGDLFISCRQNCNSVTCSMSVNHSAAPILSHKNSTRCSCLNCAYDIVAHCGQCILPAGESETTSQIDGRYYIPIQQPSAIQDCSLNNVCGDQKMMGAYDDKLLCKIKNVNDENTTKIYQSEINSKLPLKKRFKSMMSVNYAETPIKREINASNYPSTPMISIAALESRGNIESSSKIITHQINSTDTIRNNYNNGILNGYHKYDNITCGNDENEKREFTEMENLSLENVGDELKQSNSRQLARPLKKVKEQKSSVKKATKRTRSSQRQVPKINYSYMDVDCEWNPSGETKRKRQKKMSR
ncbi:hypothetical protein PV327_003366 [Microctonus hyperodae]|uniref:Uncharacterized protein n=1 Tax=Microctonus hyperodae TaxID=165561 RepID=A0AA39L142_MICHY|nr:hypothetical protein PV327_003366 [Microctonus hyperodae]